MQLNYSFVFYVYCICREAYFHAGIKPDDGYSMANRSGCGKWYHNKCMLIQVKAFWDKEYHVQWMEMLFEENKLYENENKLYENENKLYENENKGLLSG